MDTATFLDTGQGPNKLKPETNTPIQVSTKLERKSQANRWRRTNHEKTLQGILSLVGRRLVRKTGRLWASPFIKPTPVRARIGHPVTFFHEPRTAKTRESGIARTTLRAAASGESQKAKRRPGSAPGLASHSRDRTKRIFRRKPFAG